MRTRITSWLVLAVIVVVSSLALLPQEFFRPHDFLHGARIAEMARILTEGQFPPRWSGNFGYGYGMPLFEFYAPLPYLFASLFVLIGLPLIPAVQLLFIATSIITAIGSYKLGKELFGTAAGWLLASLFVLAPYRAVNLYVRGAVSELWAMAAYPWILFSLVAIYKRKWWGKYALTASLVVLFLSHNISVMLFAPVVGAVVLVMLLVTWQNAKRRKYFKSLVIDLLIGGLVALGLSSFYLVPAFFEKSFTQVESRISGGYFSVESHSVYPRQFLTPQWGFGGSISGPDDGMSFFIGYPQLMILVGAVLYCLYVLIRRIARQKSFKPERKLVSGLGWLLILGLASAGTLFLMLRQSLWIWNALPVLAFVQFPWRLLGVSALLLSLLGAALFTKITPERWRPHLAIVASVLILLLHSGYFKPESYLSDGEVYYFSDPTRISRGLSDVLPDYFPTQFSETTASESLLRVASSESEESDDLQNIRTTLNSAHHKRIEFSLSEPQQLVASVADFPGWQVVLNSKEIEHITSETGLITFPAPAGSHSLELLLKPTLIRRASDLVSLGSLLVLIGLLTSSIMQLKTQRKST